MIVTKAKFIDLFVVAAVAAAASACSSGSEDVAQSGSAACAGTARRVTQESREISFSSDVLPILQGSCSFSSCHGTPGRNGLYLAPSIEADPAGARAALLETGAQAPFAFVTPGDPAKSWLMRKLDGDFCGVSCEGGCGERMPKAGDPLDPASANMIASWIAQGARNN